MSIRTKENKQIERLLLTIINSVINALSYQLTLIADNHDQITIPVIEKLEKLSKQIADINLTNKRRIRSEQGGKNGL